MVVISENQYDNGMAGGNGNMTQYTEHVDSVTSRVTAFAFDWRNRQVVIDGEVDLYAEKTIDNMDRQLQIDRRNTCYVSFYLTGIGGKSPDLFGRPAPAPSPPRPRPSA